MKEGVQTNHRLCNRCRGRLIWIAPHIRGDSSLGWVSHDYTVTARRP